MNRVALVTGGARGIGASIVRTLADEGYSVAVCYNTSVDRAKALQAELSSKGVDNIFVKADIADQSEIDNLVDKVMKKFGKIDVLINNSATTHDSLFADKDMDSFARVLRVNLVGSFYLSKLVGQIMYENKHGKIINISSTNGDNTYYPMCAEYDASKAGLNSLTHNLAMQFAPYVTCNAIAPGFIATESEVDGMDEEYIADETSKIMVRRAGTEEDVAGLVSYLASSRADFINNQVIKIDGGVYGD